MKPALDVAAPGAGTRSAARDRLSRSQAESPAALAYAIPFALMALVPSSEIEAGAGGPFSISAPLLLDRVLFPLVSAIALLSALELTGLLVGRGRAIPAAGALVWARPALVLVLTLTELLYTLDDLASGPHVLLVHAQRAVTITWGAAIFAAPLTLCAYRVARGGHVSILPALLLVAAAAHVARACSIQGAQPLWSSGGILWAILGNGIMPVAAVMAALRLAPLRDEDLRRLGVTAWTRDDLALAPLALVGAGLVVHQSISFGTPPGELATEIAVDVQRLPYLGLPAAAFICGTVVTLARWLRESDARRARR